MSDNEEYATEYAEDDVIHPKAHKRLLQGVNSLHTTQFIKKATRNEAAAKRSEFHLVKTNTTNANAAPSKNDKVNVFDLMNVLDKTSKHLDIGKKLKKTVVQKKVLPKPLEKPVAEKLQRAINYEKTKEKLLRWDAIVSKQKSADHLTFPLNQDVNEIAFKDSYQVPSKFRIKSEMMQEMESIEPDIFQIGKPEDIQKEEEPKLTRAEMIERSRELRALRLRESQKSAKAHHQNKIKSKKYHRILKKEKMRQQIKEFELLQKTDPEAALRKIEQLDRSRIEERANLRHRNTGTWAKNLQVRAKYDKDVRKELADQIAISRELTAKKQMDSSDDEANETAPHERDDDCDPFNPWLTAAKTENGTSNEVDAFLGDYRKYWTQRNQNALNVNEYNNAGAPDTANGTRSDSTDNIEINGFTVEDIDDAVELRKLPKVKNAKTKSSKRTIGGWVVEDIVPPNAKAGVERSKKSKKVRTVENIDDLFDDAEDEMKDKAEKKFREMQPGLAAVATGISSKKKKRNDSAENEIDLSFTKQIKRAKIDEALIANGDDDDNTHKPLNGVDLQSRIDSMLKTKASAPANNVSGDASNINPDDIAKVKTVNLKTALPSTIYTTEDDGYVDYNDFDYHFDDEKQLAIAQAFEDDDIVAEFQREKEEEAKKNDPQEIELTMPGWGSWSGAGIDPSKRKPKRRIVLKFPPAEKRRPDNHGSNVVIIENRDEKLQKHLVSKLPFPFTSVEDYEQSIRAPIGRDFVPATAHRLLTKPAVVTKSGTIIEPMNENMLLKKPQPPRSKTDRKIAEMQDDDD